MKAFAVLFDVDKLVENFKWFNVSDDCLLKPTMQ